MNRSSSNSSSRSLRNKINELESEIQNIKETFKYFFSKFPEYENNNQVPVLENSDIVAGRIKKALTLKPLKVIVLRNTPKRRFRTILTRRKRNSPKRASI